MYSIGFNDKDFKRNEELFKSYTSLLNDLKELLITLNSTKFRLV
jgi:hypothetical protein